MVFRQPKMSIVPFFSPRFQSPPFTKREKESRSSPRAAGTDFHWLTILNPSVRTHAGKAGHRDFNLKLRASGNKAVSFHLMFFKLVKRFPAG